MRRFAVLLLALASLATSGFAIPPAPREQITVAEWNVESGGADSAAVQAERVSLKFV